MNTRVEMWICFGEEESVRRCWAVMRGPMVFVRIWWVKDENELGCVSIPVYLDLRF